jgi:hypothetical protein
MDRIEIPEDKPTVQLVGLDGNAYAILGRARHAMTAHGWDKALIDQYHAEATSGDYDHLLRVTMEYTEEGYEDE